MKKNGSLAVFAVCLIMLPAAAQSQAQPTSLTEALQIAFRNNPRTQANEMRLKAALDDLEAARARAYGPTVNMSYSSYRLKDRPVYSGDAGTRARSNDSALSLNINVFNGFADYYRLKTLECNSKQQEAIYNSTNTTILNTKGQIAGLVATNFVEIARGRQNVRFTDYKIELLTRAKKFATSDKDVTRIDQLLDFLATDKSFVSTALQIAESKFQFAVTVPASQNADNLDQTIPRIVIPTTFEEALTLALQKSPEVVSARFGVECSRLSKKANQAEQYGVRVDIGATKYRNRLQEANAQAAGSRGTTWSLTLSKSFDLGMPATARSSSKLETSAEMDLEGAIATVKSDLSTNYLRHASVLNIARGHSDSFEKLDAKINSLIQEIEAGRSTDLEFFLDLYTSYDNTHWNMLEAKTQLINIRFETQRNIGTLFDLIEL